MEDKNWIQVPVPSVNSGGSFNGIHFADKNNGWAVNSRFVFNTTDGGINWFEQKEFGATDLFSDVHFVDITTGWVVGRGGIIYKTTNRGLDWTNQSSALGHYGPRGHQ